MGSGAKRIILGGGGKGNNSPAISGFGSDVHIFKMELTTEARSLPEPPVLALPLPLAPLE